MKKLLVGIICLITLVLMADQYIQTNLVVNGTITGNASGLYGTVPSQVVGWITPQLVTTTNGLVSLANNGSSLTTISVGSSPFTYQNNSTNNQTVYVSGGTITALSINGTSIFSGSTVGNLIPVEVQSNEVIIVTYSSTPSMYFKPL